jgi:4-hydroxybenzoate polyprenyltransferase
MALQIVRISRPRFWIYLLGPYLIGLLSASEWHTWTMPQSLLIAIFFLYFIFPANLLLYGINDIFDYETDILNNKKSGYESVLPVNQHTKIWLSILVTNVPFLLMCFFLPLPFIYCWGLFILFSIFYSAPPLRFKTKPLVDSISNGLYILPGIMAYYLVGGTTLPWGLIAAAWAWAMAMHAYSAIPDIDADKKASLATIATFLGKSGTLLFCTILYLLSCLLAATILSPIFYLFGAVYIYLMTISFSAQTNEYLLQIYRYFPLINCLCGFAIFVLRLLKLI